MTNGKTRGGRYEQCIKEHVGRVRETIEASRAAKLQVQDEQRETVAEIYAILSAGLGREFGGSALLCCQT